jgi:hypothetical protein
MDRLRALRDLTAGLQGRFRRGCDWPAVVALANQSLTTPRLAAAVAAAAVPTPPEIARFLDEVLRRNRERNERLWRQLLDAVGALNAAGVTPTAMKGVALWLWSGAHQDRLMSDVDLLIEPAEVETALAALTAAGFQLVRRQVGPLVHVVAELGRPQDAGYVDLHQRPPGPPGLLAEIDLTARRREVVVEGRRLREPDAAAQILQLVLHDQFHDGDFWRGGLDLRHQLDTAQLAADLSPADLAWLRGAFRTRLARHALEAQLCSARRLAGAPSPRACTPAARWTAGRWRWQYAYPALRLPLAAAALALGWRSLAEHRRAERKAQRDLLRADAAPPGAHRRLERLAQIMSDRPGKL